MSTTSEFVMEYFHFDRKAFSFFLESSSAEDVAKFLEGLKNDEIVQILPLLSRFLLSSVLSNFDNKTILTLLEPASYTYSNHLFYFLSKEKKEAILSLVPTKRAESLKTWKPYLKKTAGFYMDSTIFPLNEEISVKSCLQKLQKKNNLSQYIYFINENRKLTGVLSIKRLLEEKAEGHNTSCKKLLSFPVSFLHFDNNTREVLNNKSWNHYHTLPVVDYDESFLGVIDYSTLNQIRQEIQGGGVEGSTVSTSGDLSELYSLGLGAIFQGVSSLSKEKGD